VANLPVPATRKGRPDRDDGDYKYGG